MGMRAHATQFRCHVPDLARYNRLRSVSLHAADGDNTADILLAVSAGRLRASNGASVQRSRSALERENTRNDRDPRRNNLRGDGVVSRISDQGYAELFAVSGGVRDPRGHGGLYNAEGGR